MTLQSIRIALSLLLAAALGALPSPAFAQPSALAPSGKLRVLSFGNGVLYPTPPAAPTDGVAHAYAGYIAKALKAELVPIVLPTPDAYTQAVAAGDFDITIGPRNDSYAPYLAFGPEVAFIDNSFIAAPGKTFADVASVDRAGVRVGVGRNGAPEAFLKRTLKNAELVSTAGGPQAAIDALRAGIIDVYGSNGEVIAQLAEAVPGSRVVGVFATVSMVVSVPKAKQAELPALAPIVRDANAAGTARGAIARLGLKGVRAAE